MSFETCKNCGTLLKNSRKEIGYCRDCHMNHIKEYVILREYLETHPNASVMEIVNKTNLSFPVISRFIKEEAVDIKSSKNKRIII